MNYNKSAVLQRLNTFFETTEFSSIDVVNFSQQYKKILLYPTDDLLLNEKQFSALLAIVGRDERLYILDDGYRGQSCIEESKGIVEVNRITVLEPPLSYEKYSELLLMPICIMFSESLRWVIVVDEMLVDGIAILSGEASIVSEFELQYETRNQDVVNFIEYCLEQHQNHGIGLDGLLHIIKQIK